MTKTIGTDTDDLNYTSETDATVLLCFINGNESATQTEIPIAKKQKNEKITFPHVVDKKDVGVGTGGELRQGFLGFENVKDDCTMKQLGGVTLSFYDILLQFIKPKNVGQPSCYKKLSAQNRLLLFLMKMKLGIPFTALACIFSVSHTNVSDIFFSVLETIFLSTKNWLFWPSKEAIRQTMPLAFNNYPNCRAIIDCFELKCDTPPTVEQRVLMYSSYKSSFTAKYLIAISPSGLITFISKGYGGRSSDSFITNDSGFLNLIEPGDMVMADKGFPQIKTELLKKQCTLVMPPFGYDPQFTPEEVLEGYSIASVRIHVERAIQRIKIYRILSHVNVELLPHLDKVVYVSSILANNKEPLICTKNKNKSCKENDN